MQMLFKNKIFHSDPYEYQYAEPIVRIPLPQEGNFLEGGGVTAKGEIGLRTGGGGGGLALMYKDC